MNLLNASRKLKHSQDRVDKLNRRRASAKDKVRWDKINGEHLELAVFTLEKDREQLHGLLTDEGYYRWAQ